MSLDTVSLIRCRLVCKDWAYNIDQFILNSPILRPILLERWYGANCSIYPITSEGNELLERKESPETRYRNIISFKGTVLISKIFYPFSVEFRNVHNLNTP